MSFDLKLVGGLVVDGAGAAPRVADVGVKDGRIAAIGPDLGPAREIIDATGKVVAPGFVDVHTHYDAQAFWDPTLSPSCYHGVTTVIGGNCGFSIAPLTPDAGAYLMPMLARVEGMPLATLEAGVPWDWRSFGEFLDRLENRLALNAGFMVGHSAVRRVVMGERATGAAATPEELDEMKALVSRSIAEGALGFSTTVSNTHNDAEGRPVPSRHATREELLGLAAVVKDHEGTLLELLPDLAFDDATVQLLTDFSLAGERLVNWNVLVAGGADEESVARVRRQLSATDYARAHGAEVLALTPAAPMTLRLNLFGGFVFDALNGWAEVFRLPPAERIERLKDPAYRRRLDQAARESGRGMAALARWETFTIVETHSPATAGYRGKTVGEVAAAEGKSPIDAMLDIAIADGLKTVFVPPVRGDDEATGRLRAELWTDDRTVVGASDAGAHMDMIDTFAFSTKLLGVSRRHGLLPIEEAVRQLTSVPARMAGLRERGELRVGWCADLVVFDPATVDCGATYTRFDLPGGGDVDGRVYADAIGVEHVIVNGQVVVRAGKITEARPGAVLRSGRDTYTVPLKRPGGEGRAPARGGGAEALRPKPLREGFVAEVEGVELSAGLSDQTAAAIRAALEAYGLLVFRGCGALSDAAFEAFGRRFGPLFNVASGFEGDRSVLHLTNLDPDGKILPADDRFRAANIANALWHVDNSFSEPPAKYSALLAKIIPPTGGDTEFADMRAAYAALDEQTRRRIDGLQAIHSYAHSRAKTGVMLTEEQRQRLPERVRPLVWRNPAGRGPALYLASHIRGIVGWDDAAAQALVEELTAFATQPRFVYSHVWRPGDLLMYDNQKVMHRATPFPDMLHPRDMRALRTLAEPA